MEWNLAYRWVGWQVLLHVDNPALRQKALVQYVHIRDSVYNTHVGICTAVLWNVVCTWYSNFPWIQHCNITTEVYAIGCFHQHHLSFHVQYLVIEWAGNKAWTYLEMKYPNQSALSWTLQNVPMLCLYVFNKDLQRTRPHQSDLALICWMGTFIFCICDKEKGALTVNPWLVKELKNVLLTKLCFI